MSANDLWMTIKTMQLGELITNGGWLLLLLLSIVQIAPIKVNPWSWIARTVGRAINGETVERMDAKMDELRTDINNLRLCQDEMQKSSKKYREKQAEKEAVQARNRIVRFADEHRRNIKHSQEFFDQILDDISDYHNYCETHDQFENGKAVMSIKAIEDAYNDPESFL